jgi:RHS repeat-associated protein
MLPTQPIMAGTASGFLPAGESVDAVGQFNYDLPLDVPAGVAGMTPRLTLHYRSGDGNGPLGRGWSVQGWTSAITLCQKTIASDGVTAGLAFDGTASLCLDGAKLVQVRVPDGSPVEYRTEQDSITRIVAGSQDAAFNGYEQPLAFNVYLENGRTRTYAAVTQTRLAGRSTAGTVVPRWLLTQEQDRAGNTIQYVYNIVPAGAAEEILVDHIDYGTISSSTASRTVQFTYQPKRGTDANATAYQAGLEADLSQRLYQIQMLAPDPSTKQVVWSYQLGYQDQGFLGRALLTSVQKTGGLGTSSVVRTFTWQSGDPLKGIPETVAVDLGTHSTAAGDVWTWQVLDLNGDGKDDLVAQTTGAAANLGSSYEVYLSTGAGFTKQSLGLPAGATFSLGESRVIDFSGNGQKGLLAKVYRSTSRTTGASCASVLAPPSLSPPFYQTDDCYDYVPLTWTGSSFTRGSALGNVPNDSSRLAVADMDGDGLLDVVSTIDGGTTGSEWAAQLNLGGGSFAAPVLFPSVDTKCNIGATPANLTGDGRGQVMVAGPQVEAPPIQVKRCVSWGDMYPYGQCKAYETYSISGGMACLNSSVALMLAPGQTTGGSISLATATGSSYPQNLFLADLNGDNLQDLVTLSGGAWYVQWNTGNGMGAPTPLTGVAPLTTDGAYPVSTTGGPPFIVLDLNRDGRDDVLVSSSTAASGGSASTFAALVSNGDGSFSQPSTLNMGAAPAEMPGTSAATTIPVGAGDFDGDGKPDLLLPQYNTAGYIQQLQPVLGNMSSDVDLLIGAWDEGVLRFGVQYGRTNPADAPFTDCNAFPQVCIRRGMPVVAWMFGADVGAAVYYRFENPRMDAHGRGFIGYDTMREWQPFRPWERTTTYNNTFTATETLGGAPHQIYPYAGLAATVTTVTGVVTHDSTWMNPAGGGARQSPPWSQPGSQPDGLEARITSSSMGYVTMITPGSAAYLVAPLSVSTNEWEGSVTVDWNASDPVHLPYTTPSSYFTTWSGFYTYDGYANLTSSNEYKTGGIHSVVNAKYYSPSISNWQVSQLEQKQVMNWTDASGDGTAAPANYTTTQYTYDARGYLATQVVEPLAPAAPDVPAAPGATADLNETITYTFDGNGRLRQQVAKAGDTTLPPRSLYLDYADVLGSGETVVYPSETWNEAGVGSFSWTHPAYGVPVATMDANGVTSTFVHDDLGRMVRSNSLVTSGNPSGLDQVLTGYSTTATGNLLVSTQTSSGSLGYSLSDELGRTVETGTLGLAGQYSVVDTSYDVFGRVASVTNPGWGTASTSATVKEYDSLNRPVAITGPDGSQTTFSQGYFYTFETDPVGRLNAVFYDYDHRPQISQQYDTSASAWRSTSYTYGPFGHINTVTDPNNNVTSMQYDLLGRRTQMVDPDSGPTSTFYDGYGEVRETDMPTSSTTFTMDAAGRVTLASNTVDGKTQYLYDLATDPSGNSYGPDKGKLSAAIAPGSVRVDYYYDALSRPSQQTYSSTAFSYQSTFSESYNDPYGRLTTVTYPAVPGRTPFQTLNKYTNGYLAEVDRNLPTGAFVSVKQITATDPAGDLTAATYGNGIVEARSYDPYTMRLWNAQLTQEPSGTTLTAVNYAYYRDGRAQQRTDLLSGRNEVYTYDSLRRLSTWALTPPGVSTNTTQYGYDVLGNLTQVQVNDTTIVQNTYGEYTTSRPHQLAMTVDNGNVNSYWYDAAGRQYWSNNSSIAYRENNLPASITESGVTTYFMYAADGERVEKSGPAGLTISAGHGLYERRVGLAPSGGDLHVFTIPGIAQVVYDDGAGGEKTEYLHMDALGTLGMVTDDQENATPSFQEPFGKRTDVNGAQLASYSGDVRGYFGGHEYDDDLGYINMKGRIYDPNLRRFLTPDPFVANPLDGQTYNRYSYVANDPVNTNDPTGLQYAEVCPGKTCTGHGGNGGGTMDDNYFAGPPPSPGSANPFAATLWQQFAGSNAGGSVTGVASEQSTFAAAAGDMQGGGGQWLDTVWINGQPIYPRTTDGGGIEYWAAQWAPYGAYGQGLDLTGWTLFQNAWQTMYCGGVCTPDGRAAAAAFVNDLQTIQTASTIQAGVSGAVLGGMAAAPAVLGAGSGAVAPQVQAVVAAVSPVLVKAAQTAEEIWNNTWLPTCNGAAYTFVEEAQAAGFESGVVFVQGVQRIPLAPVAHVIPYASQGGQMWFMNYGQMYSSFGEALSQTGFGSWDLVGAYSGSDAMVNWAVQFGLTPNGLWP